MTTLEAGAGLCWIDDGGAGRVAWQSDDWLGPVAIAIDSASRALDGVDRDALRPTRSRSGADDLGAFDALETDAERSNAGLRLEVRAYRDRPLLVFRIEATRDIHALETGALDRPSIAWPAARPADRREGGLPEGTVVFGHAYTEFGIPSIASPLLEEFLLLPDGHRPAVAMPLCFITPSGRALLLAPLDSFHDQVIAVPRGAPQRDRGMRAGWHGDLARVPRGFASELALWGAEGVREAYDAWGAYLLARHATQRASRYSDPVVGKLSYWTDNGAAYWYRTHEGCDMVETLERAVASAAQAAPLGAVELDSWFYPHEVLRRIDARGPDDVPPTGALTWEPRDDAFPEGLPALRRRIGGLPFVLHARHFSSRSPYFDPETAWIDRDRAHPRDPAFFRRLFGQAATWGAIEVEQDWLVECFLGVRGLREEPGRARAWQRGMDAAAKEHGLQLLLCMATPADFMQTVELGRIAAIRTSGDYRFGLSNASLWCWFLLGNALARALGLWPFKDVFLSSSEVEGDRYDGDPHADVEAMLSALSAGPVGLGDKIGRSDRARVLRTCRSDGVLVKPDRPIAAIDRCFAAHPHLNPVPLVGETFSRHPAGTWSYVATLNAWQKEAPIDFEVAFDALGEAAPTGAFVVYDWRSGRAEVEPGTGIEGSLAQSDWRLDVLCPVLPGDLTLFGDTTRHACMGDRRIAAVRASERGGRGGIECEVLGAPGERVSIRGWSAGALRRARVGIAGDMRDAPIERDDATGVFDVSLDIPARGWLRLEVT